MIAHEKLFTKVFSLQKISELQNFDSDKKGERYSLKPIVKISAKLFIKSTYCSVYLIVLFQIISFVGKIELSLLSLYSNNS